MDERWIVELVRGFEDGTWPVKEWKHAHHLILAGSYVLDGDHALERLRVGIRAQVVQSVVDEYAPQRDLFRRYDDFRCG
jgi:hypothetical protein